MLLDPSLRPAFPTTTGAYVDGSSAGFAVELFVSKLTPDGSGLVYSTIFGAGSQNSGSTYGDGIAVDADGNAYITGYTSSTDFPTTVGAYQGTLAGGANVFVTKLNATGTGLSTRPILAEPTLILPPKSL